MTTKISRRATYQTDHDRVPNTRTSAARGFERHISADYSTAEVPHVRFVTTREAAELLSTDDHALRERIRRAARRIDGRYVADLGIIVFFKFGRSWRGKWTA
jgi:hypothetical protein